MEEGKLFSLNDGLYSSQSIPLQALENKTELHSLGSQSMNIRKKPKIWEGKCKGRRGKELIASDIRTNKGNNWRPGKAWSEQLIMSLACCPQDMQYKLLLNSLCSIQFIHFLDLFFFNFLPPPSWPSYIYDYNKKWHTCLYLSEERNKQ